jgi:hypothetical protein
MALTFDNIVDRAQQIGPELTQATVVSYANERVGRMVSEAEWRTKIAPLGVTTVAGQSAYNLDTDTVDLRTVFIGSNKYALSSYQEIQEVIAGRSVINYDDGKSGLFTSYSADGSTAQIYIYPAPSTTATAITAIESLHPSDSVYGGADNMSPNVPKHIRPYILDGVLADVYEFTGRWDIAQPHEQRFQEGAEKLRRLKFARVGSGPIAINMSGF